MSGVGLPLPMSTLLGLMLVPLIVTVASSRLYRHAITWRESLVQLAIASALVTSGFFITRHTSGLDREHLHGRILSKLERDSACCHCRDVCQKKAEDGRCTSSAKACEHGSDHEWGFATTVGDVTPYTCGSTNDVPLAWMSTTVGTPITTDHAYTNYLRADPDSLLLEDVPAAYLESVPPYPAIRGYQVDPVITDGVVLPPAWQDAVRELNAELGPAHQLDVTLLLTNANDPSYAGAVQNQWLYGPRNSLSIVLGVGAKVIRWARVVTYSRVPELAATLRYELPGKTLADDIPTLIKASIQRHHHHTALAEAAYLFDAVRPSLSWRALLFLLAMTLSIYCTYRFHVNDDLDRLGSHPRARAQNL